MVKKNLLITVGLLAVATMMAYIFFNLVPENPANIALIYILALVLIAQHTDKYWYGIAAALLSVIFSNYLFTYPYCKINFTLTGYPITFIEMLTITLLVSTTTSLMKRQAEILSEKEKQLMEADKEKLRANLLRAVSHDLRTPLTSIIGTVSSLLENEDTFSKQEQREMTMRVYDDSQWLLNMVENLLSVTRIQNNETKLKKTLEPVEEVVSEAVTRLRKRLPEASIHVCVPDELIMIPMDAMLIEQVIMNLIENAVIHSESKRPIEIRVDSNEKWVFFHVIDFGIGIDENKIEDLFDGIPLDGAQIADSRKGMGIGLSICKTILIAHGGTISAKNHIDGAEFQFMLPREDN